MAQAGSPDTLTMGAFAPSPGLVAGQQQGFFAKHGVRLVLEHITSSDEQFRGFAEGRYDVLQTALDNVANYRFNTSNDLGRTLDVQADFAMDLGMELTAVGAPDVVSTADVRGGRVGVDAADSGYAYVMYRMLEEDGLHRDSDYEVVRLGGVAERYANFIGPAPAASVTLLSNGFEALAGQRGLKQLGTEDKLGAPYVGCVAAYRGAWYRANQDLAQRFRAGYEDALSWVFHPSNRAHAVRLVAQARRLNARDAELVLNSELGRWGVARDTKVQPDAAQEVFRLRQHYGGFDAGQVPDAEQLAGLWVEGEPK